jgi:predicted HAD superfamily Cof-like phosphohydrolase
MTDQLSNFSKVIEFHKVMGMSSEWPPSENLVDLRNNLIQEEVIEVNDELFPEGCVPLNKQKVAKELADLLYVTYGTAVSFGIDIDRVFAEVHRSNMSKLVNGKPLKREDGKVLKGPHYTLPDLSFIDG